MTRSKRFRLLLLPILTLPVLVIVLILACNKTPPSAPNKVTDSGPPMPVVPPGPDFFEDVTDRSGIKFTYNNGESCGYFSILSSLGGGGALIDYDGDGLLDIFVPGGGYYDPPIQEFKKKIR